MMKSEIRKYTKDIQKIQKRDMKETHDVTSCEISFIFLLYLFLYSFLFRPCNMIGAVSPYRIGFVM